ncbi:vWA domain-containing protein [Sphingomonas rustica]|uniref:vWA domain-containing protein n=1 Tax=Sphingomonas rustica TaxID=3103142 RepID=UPI0031FBD586
MKTAVTGVDPRAYVTSFITEDVEACFRSEQMEQPVLEAKGAPSGSRAAPVRVVVAVDGSGSMAGRLGGQTKLDLARRAALAFVDGLPDTVQTSLLVFGQQGSNSEAGKARSCAGVDMLAPMSTDRARLVDGVGKLKAVGWTPLALALERAEALLQASSVAGEQIIYVVSDGEETCGGDPVAVARRINTGKSRAIVNVIGFGLPSGEAAALKAVADAGGGSFVNVANQADYDRTMAQVREANRTARNMASLSNSASRNSLKASAASTRASLCVSDIVASESRRMSDDIADRDKRGMPYPRAGEALRLQQERHRALLQRSQAFSRASLDSAAAARERMEKADAAAR